ncbi:SDR family oxidoreductase [Caulobacter sp. S45]|uniref:SDR family NAD(P)-dependent oxidoreductase n=1 Tax=Caulobacter sp. S45 TaxID=1641861 RepID=UPI001C2DC825|nr:SDR family NAD(P)-dependent oxidoreductase [Caulobacter sp. S45]
MTQRMQLDGRTALITGAGSGIGRAVAVSLARRGCNLALADVNEAGMAQTAEEIGSAVRITRHRLDVSDPGAISEAPARVLADHPGVDVLVNNAGVALGGGFEQVAAADFEWLFSINFWGVVRMTRAFLPILRRSPDARLVNLSSIFGIIAPPGQTAYVASKFAVRGFSESLRHELKDSPVGVTVVHPGGVATSIARNARLPPGASAADMERRLKFAESKLTLSPTVAGETIVRAAERRRPRVIVGLDAKIAVAAEHFAPVSYWKLLGQRMSA